MQEIIDRINKLLALATSANEYEASAAAAKAQEILTEHNLRLEDIKTDQKSPALPIEQITIGSNSRKVSGEGLLPMRSLTLTFAKCGGWAGEWL